MRFALTAAALAVGLVSQASAQTPVPLNAQCVPAEPLLAEVQAGKAKMNDVFVDGEGDHWLVLQRDDGAAVIGWLNVERGLFCMTAGRPAKPQGGNPGRGA